MDFSWPKAMVKKQGTCALSTKSILTLGIQCGIDWPPVHNEADV